MSILVLGAWGQLGQTFRQIFTEREEEAAEGSLTRPVLEAVARSGPGGTKPVVAVVVATEGGKAEVEGTMHLWADTHDDIAHVQGAKNGVEGSEGEYRSFWHKH